MLIKATMMMLQKNLLALFLPVNLESLVTTLPWRLCLSFFFMIQLRSFLPDLCYLEIPLPFPIMDWLTFFSNCFLKS